MDTIHFGKKRAPPTPYFCQGPMKHKKKIKEPITTCPFVINAAPVDKCLSKSHAVTSPRQSYVSLAEISIMAIFLLIVNADGKKKKPRFSSAMEISTVTSATNVN